MKKFSSMWKDIDKTGNKQVGIVQKLFSAVDESKARREGRGQY